MKIIANIAGILFQNEIWIKLRYNTLNLWTMRVIHNFVDRIEDSKKDNFSIIHFHPLICSSTFNVAFFYYIPSPFIHYFKFLGIAIGLQHKKASNVWFLTIAMMIHSVTSLFCVGMKFLAIRATKRSIIIHFIMQALASPAGILLGYSILVGWKLEQTLVIDGFFAALSTGTILYITFFESLSKEKQMRVLRVCRSISMISGFGVMCALEYYIFMEKSVLNGQYVQLKSWMNGNGSHSSESAVWYFEPFNMLNFHPLETFYDSPKNLLRITPTFFKGRFKLRVLFENE